LRLGDLRHARRVLTEDHAWRDGTDPSNWSTEGPPEGEVVNIALWTVAGILAFSFLTAGLMKLVRNKQQLVDAGMTWVGDSSPTFVKSIGVLEILAAIGLIVPALTGIAPVFVPLAAVGLALVMLGAAVLHARRKEIPNILIALVILAFAVFVAWGRFGPYSFSV
jgi:uncharacterized membrane protein YphA (DoxX/SURF4 family)